MYTREAHPGENLPAHRTFEDKLAAARRLRDDVGIRRPILVDDLDGTVHTAYGLLPNMIYVLGRGGTILYKAMWTSADRVAEFVTRAAGGGPPMGQSLFHTEQAEYRRADREQFQALLARNGARAVIEFQRATDTWVARARAERRR